MAAVGGCERVLVWRTSRVALSAPGRLRWGVLVGPVLSAATGPRPGGYRKDRAGHDVGPVPGDVMAGAIDDDMASLGGGRGEPISYASPISGREHETPVQRPMNEFWRGIGVPCCLDVPRWVLRALVDLVP